ncbi:MAG TPA: acyltransferase [Pirellulales bacterium]|jgi:peptidoglycan/LPS O-acetylase OafA/YrhL|nr:acyltransferase [Pirellulales bacterium]
MEFPKAMMAAVRRTRTSLFRDRVAAAGSKAAIATVEASGQRFAFVDALRGLAALGVAAFHIYHYGPLPELAATVVPKPLDFALHHGWAGVQMFFVISGFVIAYTLRGARITPSYLGNFALRRSLRLDPPYWFTIAFVIGLYAITSSMFDIDDGLMDDAPTWDQVLAHVFYLQNILGYQNLSAGFWTLCIEVQFYILFAVLLGFAQRLTAHCSDRAEGAHWLPLILTFAPLAVASLFWFSLDRDNTDWVVHFFAFFFLGALAWWTLEGRTPKLAFWAYVAAILMRQQIEWTLDMRIALITGVAIYGVIQTGRSQRWLNFGWLQRLGKISYSLYLIHYPISWIITTLGYELTGDSAVAAAFWLVLSLAASIGVAHALHLAIEGPAIRFARRLKRFGGQTAIGAAPGAVPLLADPLR